MLDVKLTFLSEHRKAYVKKKLLSASATRVSDQLFPDFFLNNFSMLDFDDEKTTKFFWDFLVSYLFLDERSEAFSHKDTSKWFHFFLVRDIPLRFISLKLIFSAPNGRIHPIFVKTLRRVHHQSYSEFSAAENFSGELLALKISIFGFFRVQAVYF